MRLLCSGVTGAFTDPIAARLLRVYDDLVAESARSGVDLPGATERILQSIDGFTRPDNGEITVSIDSRRDLSVTVRDWLPLTLAHELHHSRRILRGPGYGRTSRVPA